MGCEEKLTHFSLFTGIGGIDLAAEWAGFESVGQCEWADYPTKVLEKHWPNVPRWRDVRDVTAESVREKGISNITLISGGFPCQPFSVAGERKGEDDDRYLWPEMVRVISELRPAWVLGENVAGIVSMALDQVLFDLESQNYSCQAFIIPAAGVDAPHKRDRAFIVAHSNDRYINANHEVCPRGNVARLGCSNVANAQSEHKRGLSCGTQPQESRPSFSGNDVRNSTGEGLQNRAIRAVGEPRSFAEFKRSDWWATEPDVGRVANGIPNRVDRLKCLGNAVVPAQVYPILQAIADIEAQVKQGEQEETG